VPGFTTHTGRIAVYDADSVDTDRIIPARFLSSVTRSGFGKLLFNDLRTGGFALDSPEARGADVLVVGSNFGCGSSREHAVWAIQQAGFVCVIARKSEACPGFSDIFRQNAINCGLLLIELTTEDHAPLVAAGSGAAIRIDLPKQTISVAGQTLGFEIHPSAKEAMIRGLDLIGATLLFEDAVRDFEARTTTFVPPWVSN
jgi:3-isopropylmalate/(R)-2-methylmalate dehydratase small subunit